MLTVYNHGANAHANYVASRDRCLRESPDPRSHLLPTFHHETQYRTELDKLNVFLVAINAEIKFRRYFQEMRLNTLSSPLPDNVLALMNACIRLVDLIYWTPEPTEGSQGQAILDQRITDSPRNLPRTARPDPASMIESSSGEDTEMGNVGPSRTASSAERRTWFANANGAQLKAYGTMLMSRGA